MRQILILLLMTSVFFMSCGKICRDKDCGEHGDCAPKGQGQGCVCEQYYTTDADGACNVEMRSNFIGTWYGNHVGSSDYYNITIEAASFDVGQIKIDNYFNFDCPNGDNLQAYAIINNSGSEIVASINSSLCTEFTLGNGVITFIDPTHIKITGTVDGPNIYKTFEGIYEKQ